jgi:hypothetical protein
MSLWNRLSLPVNGQRNLFKSLKGYSVRKKNEGACGVYGPPDRLVTTDGLERPPWVLVAVIDCKPLQPITRQGTEEHHLMLHVRSRGSTKQWVFVKECG